MRARAYYGYVENGRFYPNDRMARISKRRRALVTIFDEPAQAMNADRETPFIELERSSLKENEKELRAAWIRELDEAISLSMDEELPDIQRSAIMREPIGLSDER